MARLNVVHSSILYWSQQGNSFSNLAGQVSNIDEYLESIVSAVRTSVPASNIRGVVRFTPTDATTVTTRTDVYILIKFRLRRAPTAAVEVWNMATTAATPALHIDMNTSGQLLFYNGFGTGNLIATSAACPIGDTSNDFSILKLRIQTNAGAPNLGALTAELNGASIITSPIPGAGVGLNAAGSMTGFNQTGGVTGSVGIEIDFDQILVDDSPIDAPSRFTIVQVTGNGNYTNWAGGSPDFKFRSPYRMLPTAMTTTNLNSRQSYTIPTLSSLGITGTVKSVSICGYAGSSPSDNTGLFFFRIGGVDTDGATSFSYSATEATHKTLFNAPGWGLNDAIEIGVRTGGTAGTYRFAHLYAVIEHDTPYVPLTDQDVIIQRINYTGNGTSQSIALPFRATALIIYARSGNGAGIFWFENSPSFQIFGSTIGATIWTDGLNIYVTDNSTSYNSNGVVYDVLVIQDLQKRVSFGAGFNQISQTSPFDTEDYQVTTPLVPEAMFLTTQSIGVTQGGTFHYRTPSMGTNLTVPFASGNIAAGVINAINATGFTMKKAYYTLNAFQFPYWSLRPSGFASLKLFNIARYVGTGVAQAVAVDLSGLTPVWVYVFPENNSSKYALTNQRAFSAGPINGGAGVAGVITAFGADSVTVDGTLNTLGVVYHLLAFAEGTDSSAANQYSGIYFLDPDARHDTLWNRDATPVLEDRAIPRPTYRTHFIGDE